MKKLTCLFTALALLGPISPAAFGTISTGKDASGNLVMTDSATGLTWLNLTDNTNETLAQVQSQFPNYVVATGQQVIQLYSDANVTDYHVPNPTVVTPSTGATIQALMTAWGVNGTWPPALWTPNTPPGATSYYDQDTLNTVTGYPPNQIWAYGILSAYPSQKVSGSDDAWSFQPLDNIWWYQNGNPLENTTGISWAMVSSAVIPNTITWNKGAGTWNWDTSSPNWAAGGVSTLYAAGAAVAFDDSSGGASSTISIVGTVQPKSVSFSNNTKAYTFTGGAIGGSTSIVMSGAGMVTFTAPNSYTGGTTIDAGTLNINSDSCLGAVPSSPSVNLSFGGSGGTLQAGASVALNANRNLAIGGSGAIIDTNGYNVSIPGVISGPGALGKIGAGTLTLTAANSYAGTLINAGTLNINSDLALGAVPSSPSLNLGFFGNSTLQAGAALALNANRTVGIGGGVTATIDTNGYNMSIPGVIGGSGALTKLGVGTLTLSGSNSYTGGTTINEGTVKIVSDLGLGAVPNSPIVNLSFGNYGGIGVLQAGASLALNANRNLAMGTGEGAIIDTNGYNMSIPGVISGSGATLEKIGAGTLTITAANTYNNGTQIYAGTLNINSDACLGPAANNWFIFEGNSTLQAGASLTLAANRYVLISSGATATIDTNGYNMSIAGPIEWPGALTKIGVGTLTLSPSNSYTGGTTINGGTLNIISDACLGAVPNSPTVNLSFGNYGGIGSVLQAGASLALSANRNLAIANGAIATIDTNGYNMSIPGVISGAGGALEKIGAGTLTLTAANSYNNDTSIYAGLLNINSDLCLGPASAPGSNILFFGGNGTLQAGASVALNANRYVLISSGATATIDTNGYNMSMAGSIQGSGGAVMKKGAGTLTLSGPNSYTGTTTILQGELIFDAGAWSPVLSGPGGADLQGGSLCFNYSGGSDPAVTIQSILKAGYNGGVNPYHSGQIRDTVLPAGMTLGWMDEPAISEVIIMPTLYGDANLAGEVDVNDLTVVLTNFGQTGMTWSQGDFNNDGRVDINDLTILLSNFGQSVSSSAAGMAAVPEPSAVLLLAVGAVSLLAFVSRRHTHAA